MSAEHHHAPADFSRAFAIGIALTAHLVMPAGHPDDAFFRDTTWELHDRFEIEHVTLQVMKAPSTTSCAAPLPPDKVQEFGTSNPKV